MSDIKTIADNADVIINGYAFTRKDNSIQACQGTGTWHPRVISTSSSRSKWSACRNLKRSVAATTLPK